MRFASLRHQVEGLPSGRQFAMTWEIPDNFGGLTKAMLQRSNAFATLAGAPVAILTFSLQTNLDDVRADLRARGLLSDGVTLHNLWEDIRALPDDILREAQFDPRMSQPHEFGSAGSDPLHSDGVELARVHRTEDRPDTASVQILRTDGTVVASQAWKRMGTGAPLCEFGDHVLETALYARDGSFIGGWNGSWGLWKFWVDLTVGDSDSYAIVDSSVIADFMAHRGPGGATSLYLFHNNHLARRREPPYASLDRRRRYVSEHHANFDANIFLTDTQRLDFDKLLGGVDNSHTVPNIVTGGSAPSRTDRQAGRAVVLARFGPQKRLDHALRAISAAAASHPELHLDLYGHGPREEELRALATELGGPIAFHGYTESPALEFARSSFSLLTSTHEGLGLSVIESMAAGCVPLAYDVPYGPSDIITHGVDGFLVPAGNHRAMAKQIGEFLALDPRTVSKLRKAGRQRAADFAAKPIIAMWSDAMRAARQRQAASTTPPSTHEALSEQELSAAATRFIATTAHAELIDATWSDGDRLRMTVGVHLSGTQVQSTLQDHDVAARLIHRPTGASSPIPLSFPAGFDRPQDPPGSRYVALDIDVSNISSNLDHTVLLGLTCNGVPLWDVIRTRRRLRGSLAFPEASRHRPVLVFDKSRGVELATASPKATATASTDGNDVTLTVESLVAGAIENVQAVGLKGAPTIEADRVSTAVYRLHLPPSGTWEVHATIDGTPRFVAWGASSEELHSSTNPLAPVQLGSSPRGYLRLESSPSRIAVTGLGEDLTTQIFVESTESPVGIVAVSVSDTESVVPALAVSDGHVALDLCGLPEGTYALCSAGNPGSSLPIVDEVQDLLPRSTTREDRVFTARRDVRKNALIVDVRSASDRP